MTIDNQVVEVAEGSTILEAARQLGIEIPTLCHLEGLPPQTSCFVCVVKVNGNGRLLPSCATLVADGMVVESGTDEVRAARRTALELLLGDHLGDCIGPCQNACPAHVDIPGTIRLVQEGKLREAAALVKARNPFPAVLGRICTAFCERGCRRALHDATVSIAALERLVGDADLSSKAPYAPPCKPATGKRVAIIGAGPAGLTAAYYLQREGHASTLFDRREQPGGAWRDITEDRLPRAVLDAEIVRILALGAEFRPGMKASLDKLRKEYDAVLIAAGEGSAFPGVEMGEKGILADRHTLQTSLPGVFAAGSAIHSSHHTARAVGDGRVAAYSIVQYLAGQPVTGGERRPFSTHMGRLHPEELALLLEDSDPGPQIADLTVDDAARECARCLHCDCRKLHACRLRDFSIALEADTGKYHGERRPFTRDASHPEVIYEPGKCIDCGLCVRIAESRRDSLGLAFIGRGFDVRPAVPFGESLLQGLKEAAEECVKACPTGALSRKTPGH
ncbi:MAG: FAD-dependent oxidoreductase [Armatimonadota bacterium]